MRNSETPKKIFWRVLKAKGTFFLLALVIGFFLLLSQNYYIPQETIQNYSFGLNQPGNILFYEFIHVGPHHLASNAIALLAFGIALELALSSVDVIALFFASTVLTALFFGFTSPFANVVGASAGIISMVTAAFFSSPKKTIFAAVSAIILGTIAYLLLNTAIFSAQQDLQVKVETIKQDIQIAIQEKNPEKQRQLEQELGATMQEKTSFEQSYVQEKNSVSDLPSHTFAAVLGILYVFIFHRKKFFESSAHAHVFFEKAAKKILRKKSGK